MIQLTLKKIHLESLLHSLAYRHGRLQASPHPAQRERLEPGELLQRLV